MPLSWSHCVVDAEGSVVDEFDADRVHATASLGKVFLLCETAEQIADGRLDPAMPLRRDPQTAVADSGLWQHLRQDTLPLADVAVLIAAVSDNWATNTLLAVVASDAVAARSRLLGCTRSGLHDRVRDVRTAGDPPALSTGTAREMALVAHRIHDSASGGPESGISSAAAWLVEGWLRTGVDLSMVAAPFRLDPLAHVDGPVRLWSKTGSDTTIRADMGVIWTDRDALSFAAMATWTLGDDVGDEPHERMHDLGMSLASRLPAG